jgi:branched-chain amino acid transport system substrate-binding protein
MKCRPWRSLAFGVLAFLAVVGRPAGAAETIKIGYIDPLSGTFAQSGDQFLKVFRYVIDGINARGGALGRKFELVAFDDKTQPAEALIALKSITDQNMPFVMQCSGSNVGAALIDGVAKHNARNPDNRIVYLNCGALADELTNEQCDFWQFRFSGNVGMRAQTLVSALPKDLKSVYLLNQDYLFGQSMQRDTRAQLAKQRPDIKVVGDELIPFGKVKDFSSYITKIKASGAQGLITGNWGPDLNLLIKSGVDAGLDIGYYTYLSHLIGGPTAVGENGENRLHSVMEFHENIPVEQKNQAMEDFDKGFREKNAFDFSEINFVTMLEMVAAAVDKAGSTDALKVAQALEGMHMKDLLGNDTYMRKDDHQLIMPYYAGVFVRGVKYDSEHTGLGWKTEAKVDTADLAQPTTCKMKRPAS